MALAKKDKMINIKCTKCIECKIKQPLFGYASDKVANYCGSCKKVDMINIKSPKCKSEMCSAIIRNKKYNGYFALTAILFYTRINQSLETINQGKELFLNLLKPHFLT